MVVSMASRPLVRVSRSVSPLSMRRMAAARCPVVAVGEVVQVWRERVVGALVAAGGSDDDWDAWPHRSR